MSKWDNKNTTTNNNKRFDRFLSERYGGATSSTIYKQIPRTNSFNEINVEFDTDMKDSTSSSKSDAKTFTAAVIDSQQNVAVEPINNDETNRKFTRSRLLSQSTSSLQIAEKVLKNIIYNWSNIQAIAREAQVSRPKTVNELIRLVRTATSKVGLIDQTRSE